MIQRLEQAQINSVQFVWSPLNYSKAFLSIVNAVPLLHVISITYVKNWGKLYLLICKGIRDS